MQQAKTGGWWRLPVTELSRCRSRHPTGVSKPTRMASERTSMTRAKPQPRGIEDLILIKEEWA